MKWRMRNTPVIVEAVRKLTAIAADMRDRGDLDDLHEAFNIEEVIDLLTEGEYPS